MLLLLQDLPTGPVVVSFFFAIEEKDCFHKCGTTHARDDNAAKNLLHIAESALNSPYFESDKKIHLTNSYGTLM